MALIDAIRGKDFALIAEMETPKGVDLSDFVAAARSLKGRVDAVLIPDMGYAVMRLSALAGAVMLKEQGLETIVQFSCRDRNRLALQSDLLGAHILGIPNLMAVDGEPVQMGDHLDATPVNDLDAKSFLAAACGLAEGADMAGKQLKGAPSFCLGARISPWVDKAQARVRAAEAKAAVDAGAQFLIAPPVFDLDAFSSFMSDSGDFGAPVIGTVVMLKSVGMARYMNQNVAGCTISEEAISRIRRSGDRIAECVKIAAETVTGLKPLCQGAYLVTMGWEARLADILDQAGY